MSEKPANVIPLGGAVSGNARKAQMVEHFARKLDAVLADGASELSVAFVIYGYKPGSMSNVISYDVAEDRDVPVRMILTDAASLLENEAYKMREPKSC